MTTDTRRSEPLRIAVRAGGGLVIRRGADDGVRVVVVHRPQRDDWSFPKGGQRRGETLAETALREVREETGYVCAADAVIGVTEYLDRFGRLKLVRYWAMRRLAGSFTSNDEVDAIAWLRPQEAVVRLTHQRDVELLETAAALLTAVIDAREPGLTRSHG